MARPQAVLWDVDGTLAETERDGHRVAFNLAFEACGVPWRWDEEHYGELLRIMSVTHAVMRTEALDHGLLQQPIDHRIGDGRRHDQCHQRECVVRGRHCAFVHRATSPKRR